MSRVDDLAPDYMGEDLIRLTLSQETQDPRAFSRVDILVDYAQTLPAYVVLPLELIIRAPSNINLRRVRYFRSVPELLTFQPQEGGTHLVLLRETGHDLWHGKLRVEVAGDRLTQSNL